MKFIVTGGAGFIGSHLVERLVNEGHEVLVIDNLSTGSLDNLKSVEGKYHFAKRDIGVFEDLGSREPIYQNVDCVFHLAALARMQRSIDDPVETHIANVNGTVNVLEFARRIKAKRVVYASSSSAYGEQDELPVYEGMMPNPQNPYAGQKYIGEVYMDIYQKVFGLETVSLRFFNVYGPRMSLTGHYKLVFGNWILQMKAGKSLEIFGDGEQTRDFTFVTDVVEAMLSVTPERMSYPNKHLVFNVCSGKETSVNQLAQMFSNDVIHIEARAGEEKRKYGTFERIKQLVGWTPKVFIDEGVRRLRESYEV